MKMSEPREEEAKLCENEQNDLAGVGKCEQFKQSQAGSKQKWVETIEGGQRQVKASRISEGDQIQGS